MAIGERIHFLRNLRGMTQKYLGMAVGFSEKTADVRMAQYESGTRTPKADLTTELAHALDVSPKALDVPDIDTEDGLMHTLFALEDMYGLKITKIDGALCLRPDTSRGGDTFHKMISKFRAWEEQAAKLAADEISKEEYDRWRYRYPKFDTTRIWSKPTSRKLTDDIGDEPKKKRGK